jgi:hypothetical protein
VRAPLLLAIAGLALVGCGRTRLVTPKVKPPPLTCVLSVTKDSLDFGEVEPPGMLVQYFSVKNSGQASCDVTSFGLRPGSAPEFTVISPYQGFRVEPGVEVVVSVQFWAKDVAPPPLEREGIVLLETTDAEHPELEVAVKATLAECLLSVTPNPLDFGNVQLNTSQTHPVTISNVGNRTCSISQVRLVPPTDPLFTLPSQPTLLDVNPKSSVNLQVTFTASDSAPPHQRTGTLGFATTDTSKPTIQVPLSAFVNTVCTQAGQFIYTVDNNGRFSRFDPKTLTYLDLGTLRCPTFSSPFSMNVDQAGSAWVIFSDGHLFKVDTTTAQCSSTAYVPGQQGFQTYGMGSVFNSTTGVDTLYLSAGPRLGTLDLSNFQVASKGPLRLDFAELAGTGDGQLWAFEPAGFALPHAELDRVDPTDGHTLETYDLSAVNSTGGFAIKFFGGSFFIFVGSDVWKVDRASLDPTRPKPTSPPVLALTSPGRDIVGAGVSTCAPVH